MPPRVSCCTSPGSSPAAVNSPCLATNLLGVVDEEAGVEAVGIFGGPALGGLHQIEGEAVVAAQDGEGFLAAHGDKLEAEEAREEVGKRSDIVRAQIEVVEFHDHVLSFDGVADRIAHGSRLEGRRRSADRH